MLLNIARYWQQLMLRLKQFSTVFIFILDKITNWTSRTIHAGHNTTIKKPLWMNIDSREFYLTSG